MKPAMQVVMVSCKSGLLQNSNVGKAQNNDGLNETIQPGSGNARSRGFNGWDAEDDDFEDE
jgi:hypothetical protein